MDGRAECLLFLQKSVLTEFALVPLYEIDTSLLRTLLAVFQIHTKSKYQSPEAQIVECKRHSGDMEQCLMKDSNRFSTEGLWERGLELY